MANDVILTCQLSKNNVPITGQQQLIYVLIGVKPTGTQLVSMPLNFGLVLDRSGSMSGEKIKELREAVKYVIDLMQPTDYISITIFDDKVETIVPTQLVTDKEALKKQVDKITDRGGTTISLGMREGLKELKKNLSPNRITRMLLMTDGQTWGDEDKCQALATDAGNLGIPITAMGFGDDWNEKLLDAIAANSKGHSDYIETPDEVKQLFGSEIKAMQSVAVKDAVLTLRLSAGVAPKQVFRLVPIISNLGYTPISDRDVTVPLGELEKDKGQLILVELLIPSKQPGNYRIAQAEVSYNIPSANITGEKVKADVILGYSNDTTLTSQVNPDVMNWVEKATVFKLQTKALDEAAVGNIQGATQKLRAAATRLLEMGEVELANAANKEAENLEKQGQMSSTGTKKLTYGTRKLSES